MVVNVAAAKQTKKKYKTTLQLQLVETWDEESEEKDDTVQLALHF